VKLAWGITILGNVLLALALFGGVKDLLLPGVFIGCGGVFILFILSFRN